jgi:RNA polymerase sigma-70 factor (ECF subfamily)
VLYRRTGDRERAEDLAQEVFLRALEAPPRNPRPWLFAVALNLARDEGRRWVRQTRHLALLKNETDGAAVPPPDEALESKERQLMVREALDELTETDRSVLLMQAEGLSYDEIATGLGLAKGSIGTTLARARRKLVEAYREKNPQHGDTGQADAAR